MKVSWNSTVIADRLMTLHHHAMKETRLLLLAIKDIFYRKASLALLASLIIWLIGIVGIKNTRADLTYLTATLISSWIGIVFWTSLLIKKEIKSNWLSLLMILLVYVLFGVCAISLGTEVFYLAETKSDSFYLSALSFLGNGNFNECKLLDHDLNAYTCQTYRMANTILSIAGHIHGAISLALLMLWLKIE